MTKITCIGAGYVGGPTMAMIALKCPHIEVRQGWLLRTLDLTMQVFLHLIVLTGDGFRVVRSHGVPLIAGAMLP